MQLSNEQKAVINRLLHDLSHADRTTVVAALNEADSRIGTSRDSANYAFLKQLDDWGFAEELDLGIDLGTELQDVLTSFTIHEEAKGEIASLLEGLPPAG